jgi:MFS family permease
MDVSSELIHSLLPVFMLTSLGISVLAIGLIEGAAEAIALIVKVFSGAISDYWGRRKPLALMGYGLGALSKPLFALAGSVDSIVTARLLDRVGKGIRGAPRDALVADIAPPELRGAGPGTFQRSFFGASCAARRPGVGLDSAGFDRHEHDLRCVCLPLRPTR